MIAQIGFARKAGRLAIAAGTALLLLRDAAVAQVAPSANTPEARNWSQEKAVPSVPATVGIAQRKDIPVYLNGLGTVQAFNTVTVNTRVDGQLEQVDFTEGQDVKAGDVLAQIDPRPFQAALDLAKATKAKDQAQLENAKLDLQRYQKGGPLANTQQQIDTQAALVKQLEATVQADQANIEAAQVQLDYTTIKAPLSGRTGDSRSSTKATSSTPQARQALWSSRNCSRSHVHIHAAAGSAAGSHAADARVENAASR